MDEVINCTMDLQQAIRKSRIYAEFEEARVRLDNEPELKQKVDEFRGKNFELQNTSDNVDFFFETLQMEQKYQLICKNPVALGYLEKELALCRMIQKIGECLAAAIEIDIESFEDAVF